MDDYSKFVPQVHFEQIPIKNLVSNQEYQRNLSVSHIERAAANFDLYQINPVKVSRREGINYVFNGQHTIEIVALVSGSRDTPVWCMIYDDLSYKEEADIFANQMKFVKPLTPYEIFTANIEAQSDHQLIIRDTVEAYGLKISSKRGNNTICAVGTIERIYEKYGYQILNRVIRLCVGTWEGESESFSSNILNAIAKLVATYKSRLNEDIFKERVGSISLRQLARNAKERRGGCMGYAEAMIIAYNGRKKNFSSRLAMNKLYAKECDLTANLDEQDEQDDDFYDLTDMDDDSDDGLNDTFDGDTDTADE
jgi:hypothetical protein